jgi:hypothetical protein
VSLELTLARGAARAGNEKWQRHRKTCATCQPAARRRKYGKLCSEGKQLWADKQAAEAAERVEAELDRQPDPNQGELFDVPAEWHVVPEKKGHRGGGTKHQP